MPKVMDALAYGCFWLALATSTVPAQAQGSREATAASYLDRGQSWVTKGELERAPTSIWHSSFIRGMRRRIRTGARFD